MVPDGGLEHDLPSYELDRLLPLIQPKLDRLDLGRHHGQNFCVDAIELVEATPESRFT